MTIVCACGYRAKNLEELKLHHTGIVVIKGKDTLILTPKKCTCKKPFVIKMRGYSPDKCGCCGGEL